MAKPVNGTGKAACKRLKRFSNRFKAFANALVPVSDHGAGR